MSMMDEQQGHMEGGEKQYDSMVDWIVDNKLKSIGYTWLAGVGGSLGYQWTRPIPTSLKVIHSRVYAQAITLGALGGMAVLETYARTLHDPSDSSSADE